MLRRVTTNVTSCAAIATHIPSASPAKFSNRGESLDAVDLSPYVPRLVQSWHRNAPNERVSWDRGNDNRTSAGYGFAGTRGRFFAAFKAPPLAVTLAPIAGKACKAA